jgi:hypothetical protein
MNQENIEYTTSLKWVIQFAESNKIRYSLITIMYGIGLFLFLNGTGWVNTIAGGVVAGITFSLMPSDNYKGKFKWLSYFVAPGIFFGSMYAGYYKDTLFPEFVPGNGQVITGIVSVFISIIFISFISDLKNIITKKPEALDIDSNKPEVSNKIEKIEISFGIKRIKMIALPALTIMSVIVYLNSFHPKILGTAKSSVSNYIINELRTNNKIAKDTRRLLKSLTQYEIISIASVGKRREYNIILTVPVVPFDFNESELEERQVANKLNELEAIEFVKIKNIVTAIPSKSDFGWSIEGKKKLIDYVEISNLYRESSMLFSVSNKDISHMRFSASLKQIVYSEMGRFIPLSLMLVGFTLLLTARNTKNLTAGMFGLLFGSLMSWAPVLMMSLS